MQSIPVPKLRDIPHNVYRILLDTTYQYDPMIAFAMESGRTAGLRPSEAMNMRQDTSKVAVERCIRLYREGNRIRKIEIDLLKEYPLRSDEKAVGKIKRERIANVFPPLIPEFMQAYYETVCQSAASVVVREKSIVEENRVLKDSVTRLEKETEILHQRIQSLETEYQKAAETAKRYKKIIKDNVTPERAKALLDSALRPGVIKDENLEEMRKIGMQPLARAQVVATAPEFDPVALFGGTPDGEQ